MGIWQHQMRCRLITPVALLYASCAISGSRADWNGESDKDGTSEGACVVSSEPQNYNGRIIKRVAGMDDAEGCCDACSNEPDCERWVLGASPSARVEDIESRVESGESSGVESRAAV